MLGAARGTSRHSPAGAVFRNRARAARPAVRSAGFSLLEVLVALAAMALSLGVLYQAVTAVVRNVDASERRTQAVVLAESLLAQHDTIPQGGVEDAGRWEAGRGEYRWRLAAVPLAFDAAPATDWPLYRTEVWVRWGADGREREVHLVTLKLEQPAPIE